MTPQAAMTIYLTLLTAAGLYKALGGKTVPLVIGGIIGIGLRYGIIAAILYWGGFYGV